MISESHDLNNKSQQSQCPPLTMPTHHTFNGHNYFDHCNNDHSLYTERGSKEDMRENTRLKDKYRRQE